MSVLPDRAFQLRLSQVRAIQVRASQVFVIQMCATEALGGYLSAGSYVAVYATAPTSTKVTLTRTCGVDHSGVVPGGAQTQPVLSKVLVLSVVLGPGVQTQTNSGTTSVAADPTSSTLSQGAVAVTFAVPPNDVANLLTAMQVDLPYLALLPAR